MVQLGRKKGSLGRKRKQAEMDAQQNVKPAKQPDIQPHPARGIGYGDQWLWCLKGPGSSTKGLLDHQPNYATFYNTPKPQLNRHKFGSSAGPSSRSASRAAMHPPSIPQGRADDNMLSRMGRESMGALTEGMQMLPPISNLNANSNTGVWPAAAQLPEQLYTALGHVGRHLRESSRLVPQANTRAWEKVKSSIARALGMDGDVIHDAMLLQYPLHRQSGRHDEHLASGPVWNMSYCSLLRPCKSSRPGKAARHAPTDVAGPSAHADAAGPSTSNLQMLAEVAARPPLGRWMQFREHGYAALQLGKDL